MRKKASWVGLTEQLGDVTAQSISLHGPQVRAEVFWETCAEENPETELWNDRQVVEGVGGTPSWSPSCGLLNSYLVSHVFPGLLVFPTDQAKTLI